MRDLAPTAAAFEAVEICESTVQECGFVDCRSLVGFADAVLEDYIDCLTNRPCQLLERCVNIGAWWCEVY